MQAHDEIHRRQRLTMTPEGLARDTLDEIAHVGALGELLGDHDAQAGGVERIRAVMKHVVTPAQRTPKSKNG